MGFIILPTHDIITECKAAEPVFYFVDGGIKEIVKQGVIMSEANADLRRYYKDPLNDNETSPLVNLFIREYERSIEDRCSDSFQIEEYLSNVTQMTFILEAIEEMIKEIMMTFFEPSSLYFNTNTAKWLVNDLFIDAEVKRMRRDLNGNTKTPHR